MSTEPTELPDAVKVLLALSRLRRARQRRARALMTLTLAMQAQRDARNQRILTEMMQKHERLDA